MPGSAKHQEHKEMPIKKNLMENDPQSPVDETEPDGLVDPVSQEPLTEQNQGTEQIAGPADTAGEDELGNEHGSNEPDKAESTHLQIDTRLTIADVEALSPKLQVLAVRGGTVEIDAANLETIDTAGLQLLAMFARKAEANGTRVNWINVRNAIVNSSKLLGLHEVIGFAA